MDSSQQINLNESGNEVSFRANSSLRFCCWVKCFDSYWTEFWCRCEIKDFTTDILIVFPDGAVIPVVSGCVVFIGHVKSHLHNGTQ